jgi:hypothetical protein
MFMSDDVLERFTRHIPKPAELMRLATAEEERDDLDDYGAFGLLRGVRDRALFLELRDKRGNIRAFGYSWLHQMEFDPSIGITLSFASKQVKLVGRNLNAEIRPNVRLFQGITRQRVPYIQEADEATIMRAKDHETIIERIEW